MDPYQNYHPDFCDPLLTAEKEEYMETLHTWEVFFKKAEQAPPDNDDINSELMQESYDIIDSLKNTEETINFIHEAISYNLSYQIYIGICMSIRMGTNTNGISMLTLGIANHIADNTNQAFIVANNNLCQRTIEKGIEEGNPEYEVRDTVYAISATS